MTESTGKIKGQFAEHKDTLLGAVVICGVVGLVAGVIVSFIGGIGWALGSGVAIFLLLGSAIVYFILSDLPGPPTEGDVDELGYRHGCWTWKNDDDQLLREDNYIHGVKDGPQVRWHENGNKWQEIRYRNGKLHGTWTIWYENENKAEEDTYDDGRMKGRNVEWYASGQKKKECCYYDNETLHGDWTAWHENGKKRIESHFEYGTPVGTWTEWDSEGAVVCQREFTAGIQQGTGRDYFSDVSNPQTTRGNVLFLTSALLLLAFGTYQQVQLCSILFVLFVVVFIHELGHFIAATFLGIPISHFVLGIGPRLFGFHIGDTAFELRVIPLMGYVKEYDLRQKELEHFRRTRQAANHEMPYPEIYASEPRRGSSQLVSRPRRLIYLFGGIALNIATVWLIAFAGWRQKHPGNDLVEALQGSLNVMGELILVAGTMVGLSLNVGDSNGFVEGLNVLTEMGMIIGYIGLLSMYVACLNLLPIPPLDGGNVLAGILPEALAASYDRLVRPYGFVILIVLMATGWLYRLIGPPLSFLMGWLLS